jgi:hypothetical protein
MNKKPCDTQVRFMTCLPFLKTLNHLIKMKIVITHENFNSVLDRCKNGLSDILIATHGKATLIKGKHLKQWDNAGKPLLELDTKSKGFYVRRGKAKDYIFPASIQPILFEISN